MAKRVRRKRERRPWPMTLVAWLLLLQGLGGIGIGLYQLIQAGHLLEQDLSVDYVFDTLFVVVLVSLVLLFIMVLVLYAILAIFRRWGNAWSVSVSIQGFSLALAIFLYFDQQDFYIYSNFIIMTFALAMVIYLILPGVQAAFLPPAAPEHEEGAAA